MCCLVTRRDASFDFIALLPEDVRHVVVLQYFFYFSYPHLRAAKLVFTLPCAQCDVLGVFAANSALACGEVCLDVCPVSPSPDCRVSIADLHEQEHSASTASERLLHMDSLVREVLQGIRKGHEQMVDRTCGRLEALQGRVGVAGGRIDAAKGHVEGLRDNVEILRAEKDRLRKEVEGYKASLDR